MIRFGAKNDVSVKCEVSPSVIGLDLFLLQVHYQYTTVRAVGPPPLPISSPEWSVRAESDTVMWPVYHPFLPMNITGRMVATIPSHNRPILPAFPPLSCKHHP